MDEGKQLLLDVEALTPTPGPKIDFLSRNLDRAETSVLMFACLTVSPDGEVEGSDGFSSDFFRAAEFLSLFSWSNNFRCGYLSNNDSGIFEVKLMTYLETEN